VDSVDVELYLVPTPPSTSSPLDALWKWVGEECLSHHMVTKLLSHVGQRRTFDEVIGGERETLESFHGKEQRGKTFQEICPTWRANVIVFQHGSV
jgi:hypothetical protein